MSKLLSEGVQLKAKVIELHGHRVEGGLGCGEGRGDAVRVQDRVDDSGLGDGGVEVGWLTKADLLAGFFSRPRRYSKRVSSLSIFGIRRRWRRNSLVYAATLSDLA